MVLDARADLRAGRPVRWSRLHELVADAPDVQTTGALPSWKDFATGENTLPPGAYAIRVLFDPLVEKRFKVQAFHEQHGRATLFYAMGAQLRTRLAAA